MNPKPFLANGFVQPGDHVRNLRMEDLGVRVEVFQKPAIPLHDPTDSLQMLLAYFSQKHGRTRVMQIHRVQVLKIVVDTRAR